MTKQREKYHNTRIDTEWGKFDSKKEYKRWLELQKLQEAGWIFNLQRQVKFDLIPAQKAENGTLRGVFYKADFVYIKDGEIVVEDVKGYKTPEYKLKRKMMLYLLGIDIREI